MNKIDATPVARLLLSAEEAAEALRFSRARIYEEIAAGRLRSIKVGRIRRVPVKALEDYIAAREAEAS